MVTVNNLVVRFQSHTLLNNIACTLLPGRITSFIGTSGAGKTTLLTSLVGLVEPVSGTIMVDSQNIRSLPPQQRAKTIGYVSQDFNLFMHLTVLENCIDALLVYGLPRTHAQLQASEILKKLGLSNFLNHYPRQLSGGQKQRVAIARALALQPSVLLLDEPTASLDPFNTEVLISILKNLAQQGLTIGISSQDMSFMRKIVDRVYFIDTGNIVEFCDGKNMTACPRITQFIEL